MENVLLEEDLNLNWEPRKLISRSEVEKEGLLAKDGSAINAIPKNW